MSKIDDGGPAFPVPSYVNADGETHESKPGGMSLRDYFAGQAMAGLLSMLPIGDLDTESCGTSNGQPVPTRWDSTRKWVPTTAYVLADAMLSARKEVQP